MVRYLAALLLCFFVTTASAQLQCKCDSLPDLIPCKPQIFKNGARVYWQFNCDSSWLTFKSKTGRKKILFGLDGPLLELTGRLGFVDVVEYKATFLVQSNVISGCCSPPEFIVFDKTSGREKRNIGSIIFATEKPNLPFVVYYKNDNLHVKNIETNKSWTVFLPKGRISKTMYAATDPNPEYLFEAKMRGHVITVKYRYCTNVKLDKWRNSKLYVDLSKYQNR